jgi:hypothetical protein
MVYILLIHPWGRTSDIQIGAIQICRTPDQGRVYLKSNIKTKAHAGWALVLMARPERFELPTDWFEASYSIQLSYGRI